MACLALFLSALLGGFNRALAEPLDLASCVELALARNPRIEEARDAALGASLSRELASADYQLKTIPTVSGGLQGDNRTNQRYQLLFQRKFLPTGTDVQLIGGTSVFSSVPQVTIPYFTEGRLTVAQPLLQGRTRLENRERIDDARRLMAAAGHALEEARQEVALEVTRAFYEVVRAGELGGVAEHSLERVKSLGEVAEAKLELGTVSKMDVFRAELNAARIESAMVGHRARREAALDSLKMLLGLDPRLELEIDGHLQGPTALGLSAGGAETAALERRASLAEAREQVEGAERKLLLARYRLWPGIDLVGSYAQQGLGDSFRDSSRLDREEWGVGLRSSVPLERTAERVALGEAELALRMRERRYRVARAELMREVRDAFRSLERARAEEELTGRIAEQTLRQTELARFRYDKGITDNFDLVQAEVELVDARSRQILAKIETVLAAAAVRRVTGTLVSGTGFDSWKTGE